MSPAGVGVAVAGRAPSVGPARAVSARTVGLPGAAWTALQLAVLTTSWIGIRIGAAMTVSDVLLIASLVLAGRRPLAASVHRMPTAVLLPIWTLLVLELGHVLAGAPTQFLGVRMAAALVVTFLAAGTIAGDVTRVRRLTHLFAAGAAVSSIVAIASAVADLRFRLPGVPEFADREVGLTQHPNHLALTCLLGFAVAVFSDIGAGRPWRRTALIGCLAGGLLVSGSRATLLAALVLVALAAVRGRRVGPVGVAAACVAVALLVLPGVRLGQHLPALDRLVGVTPEAVANTAESDAGRRDLVSESWHEFVSSPWWGTGTNGLRDAHSLYLQVVTSGGVVLLLSLVPLVVGALSGLRVGGGGRVDPNAAAVAAWLVAGVLMNAIFDRYLYIPLALATVATYWSEVPTSAAGRGSSV